MMNKGDEHRSRFSATEDELRAAGRSPTPHAKRILTCRAHQHLRWGTKREAGRTVFFLGRAFDPPRYHLDFSGLVCEDVTADWKRVEECQCSADLLVVAPEDRVMNPDLHAGEVECLCCGGKGKQHLEVTVHGGATTGMDITCVWCHGSGHMDPEQVVQCLAERDMWCKCGNPSGEVDFHDDAPGSKHHWTCRDCGKVTQVG